MLKSTGKFNEVYGVKPLFGGIYTTGTVRQMCEEIDLFMENRIHIYLEPLRFRNDASFFSEDSKAIENVLTYASNIFPSNKEIWMPKIGINFLFKPDEAYKLADKHGLSFVVNDAYTGNFMHKDGCGDKNNELSKSTFTIPDIDLFAGITPGYLINQTPLNQWAGELQKLNSDADTILVGDRATQNVLEQLAELKSNNAITKPLIAAQGVNAKTLKELLIYADGAFIGSGFRHEGNVSLEKIREIKELHTQAINDES